MDTLDSAIQVLLVATILPILFYLISQHNSGKSVWWCAMPAPASLALALKLSDGLIRSTNTATGLAGLLLFVAIPTGILIGWMHLGLCLGTFRPSGPYEDGSDPDEGHRRSTPITLVV